MKRRRSQRRKRAARVIPAVTDVSIHSDVFQVKKQVEKILSDIEQLEDRMQDIEIHVNLLTRLFTTVCVEKFGMRVGVLKRLIKRIEKEAIRDSQILHLESLYKLPPRPDKKNQPGSAQKNEPWEDIS